MSQDSDETKQQQTFQPKPFSEWTPAEYQQFLADVGVGVMHTFIRAAGPEGKKEGPPRGLVLVRCGEHLGAAAIDDIGIDPEATLGIVKDMRTVADQLEASHYAYLAHRQAKAEQEKKRAQEKGEVH